MFSSRKHSGEHSDERLMQLVANGERWAFELLYERYFDKLVWFARTFVQDEQQAEDVVQEVFIRIIEQPMLFDSEKRFSTWIYTAVANASRNALRNKNNRLRLLQVNIAPRYGEESLMADGAERSLLRKGIQKACSSLSEKEKNIFILRFEQELSIKEIAAIEAIPEGTVKSAIYYLLKKLAPHLKEFHDEN